MSLELACARVLVYDDDDCDDDEAVVANTRPR